jgi:NADPH2:quinone reductase
MKGIQITTPIKEISELKISQNLPIPDKVRDGKVLIRVKAVGLGFPDYLQVNYYLTTCVFFVVNLSSLGTREVSS